MFLFNRQVPTNARGTLYLRVYNHPNRSVQINLGMVKMTIIKHKFRSTTVHYNGHVHYKLEPNVDSPIKVMLNSR